MKHIIVTGSSKGLGKAIALTFAKAGFTPWLTGRKEDALISTAKEIEAVTGIMPKYHMVDFSSESEVINYAKLLETDCPTIDVLVNNAGIYLPDHLLDETDALSLQMRVNFNAAYHITQRLLKRFETQRSGNIFNICSVVNRKPRPEAASYTISKFALYGYHQLLQETMLKHKVKVTAFFPSSINTSSWDGIDAPKDEFIQPEDMASMMLNITEMKPGTVPSEIDLKSVNPNF